MQSASGDAWGRPDGDAAGAQRFGVATPDRHPHEQREHRGRFPLYDEKFVLSDKGKYDSRRPQVWLLNLRNYLAGRHEEMDAILESLGLNTNARAEELAPHVLVKLANSVQAAIGVSKMVDDDTR